MAFGQADPSLPTPRHIPASKSCSDSICVIFFRQFGQREFMPCIEPLDIRMK
jgi:hypothetical protein